MALKILDPSSSDTIGAYRGGGRYISLLKENLGKEAVFISSLGKVKADDTLFIPFFNPFQKPALDKRVAKKQILAIYDVIPLKYRMHFPGGIKGTLRLWENKKALKNFDKIITISEHSKKDIHEYLHVSLNKISVTHLTISQMFSKPIQPTKRSETNSTNSDQYCLYVGDVNWNKNLVNLAKAIKIADVRCVFVGKQFVEANSPLLTSKHSWSEFNKFLPEIKNDSRFIFPGYVTDQELVKLYQNAICNVLVSRDEGFGLSYLEASSQKCPSVLSDIDVFHEIAGDAALFADPEKPEEIAEKIRELMDGKMRQKMGEKAYKQSQKFTPSKFKDSFKF